MRKILLSLVALSSLAVTIAACSGGSGGPGAEPCCTAEGQTVPPESTFNAATSARYAKAVLLMTNQCLSLASADLDVAPLVIADASPRARVQADGTYQLEIYDEVDGIPLLGRELFVRIYDSGSDVSRGVGVISRPLTAEGTIPVAPILFSAGRLGETTIEQTIYCVMKNDPDPANQLQNMHFVDIRSIVTADLAEDFVPGAGARDQIRERAKDYRHVLNSLVAAVTTSGAGSLPEGLLRLRVDAEQETDACKLGRVAHPLCGSPATAESYRYWFYLTNGTSADYDIFWGDLTDPVVQRLQALAEDLTARLGTVTDETTDPFQFAMYRQDQLMRLEVAIRPLQDAFRCWNDLDGDSDGDGLCEGTMTLTALDTAITDARTDLLAASSKAEVQAAWTTFSNSVLDDFQAQAGYGPTGAWAAAVTNVRQAMDTMHIDFAFNDPTNDSAVLALDGAKTNAENEGSNVDLNNAITVGAVLFFATVNQVP